MKKFLSGIVCLALLSAAACSSGDEKPQETGKLAEIAPVIYDNEEIKTVDKTEAGDIDSWKAQVFTPNGGNNDDAVPDSVIKSPWHTLVINGTEVPVYTARCGKGAHSFAWADVVTEKENFCLNVTLSTTKAYKKCEILPLGKNVSAKLNDKTVTAKITDYGSYTFTFASASDAKVTDPALAPITVMVTEETPLQIPRGYDVEYVEPGIHETGELRFTAEQTVYVIKSGLHDLSDINLPADSILYLERGAYLKCRDRLLPNGRHDTSTAIEIDGKDNVQITGRGLLDMGECVGGDGKFKHVFKAKNCKNMLLSGLTVVNSNTWTVTLYNCDESTVSNNLLLSYRTYSDGIMMSECRDCVGRYNFVRTGDDAIEFKGTGWAGSAVGRNCLYEYNDVWTDKGTAYGVVWESACDMTNMKFRNNSVGFAQPKWKTTNNVLDCRLGTRTDTTWSDITFENIDIYHVISPNVMMIEMRGKGANLENVLYKNINVRSTDLSVFAFGMHCSGEGKIVGVKMENVKFRNKILTSDDKRDTTLFNNKAGVWFDELTIKG
ncbi:MAG TPA: hypothetical protein DDW54_00795 [Clostridiales bacterium]|nr:hypothetical protein [Clostridiales bacterium]